MRFLIFLVLLTLSSCAGYIRTQATKMISPETQGAFAAGAIDLRLESQNRDRLSFINDRTDNPVNPEDAIYSLALLAELGIFKRLDIYFQPHTLSASHYGAKYQLVGDPRKNAKKGNFSISLLSGIGSGSSEIRSNSDLEELFNENIEKFQVDYSHKEFGLIIGHRWAEKVLHYANMIYQENRITGDVTKTTGPLSTPTNFSYRNDGVIYSTGFIFYFSRAQFKIDYSHLVSDWSRSRKDTINTLNSSIGFNW
jgi:hypothetical protein